MTWIEIRNVNLFCPQEFRGPKYQYVPAHEQLALSRVLMGFKDVHFHIVCLLKESQLLLMLNQINARRKTGYAELTNIAY